MYVSTKASVCQNLWKQIYLPLDFVFSFNGDVSENKYPEAKFKFGPAHMGETQHKSTTNHSYIEHIIAFHRKMLNNPERSTVLSSKT